MLVHRLLVESVDLRRLGGSAGRNDFLGDSFDRCQVAPGEKKMGTLRRKGTRDSAADPTSGSVDHRNLVVQHHFVSPKCPSASSGTHQQTTISPARLRTAAATSCPAAGASSPRDFWVAPVAP